MSRIYGLPKIHKEGTPLRPIGSSYNGPMTWIGRLLTNIFKNLTTDFKYNVEDTTQFQERLQDIRIEDKEKMVSFDVVSLFPSIPTALAKKIIMEKWEEIKQYLEYCIKDCRFFKYKEKYSGGNSHSLTLLK